MKLMGKTDSEVHKTLNNFTFSGVDIENLDGSEYTLVSILVDESSSVESFKTQLEQTLATVVDACKKSPQAENLLLRVATFSSGMGNRGDDNIKELHGFMNLSNIADDQYHDAVNPYGMTPLYDAAGDALESIEVYGKKMAEQDFFCNGIFFVITDGYENSSQKLNSPSDVKSALSRIRRDESLESIRAILIGVNDSDVQLRDSLDTFKDEGGFDEYISLGDVEAGKLAKLANWISQSISSQSQSLGSGGPSQPANFTL